MVIDIDRALYPFDGHHLRVNDHTMHYLDEGSGAETVVLLHGNPSWSFYFRDLVAALREDGRYRCLAPDHIGCGLSEKPSADDYPYTLERRVDDIEVWLDEVAPSGPLTLVLHDWGGMIGMAYATRHPHRIARLVLLNTAAFRLPETKPLPWQLGLVRDSAFGAALVTRFNAFARGAAFVGCRRNPMSKEVRAAYLAPYARREDRVATLRFVQDIPLKPGDPGYALVTEVEAALPAFDARPALICWGERDFVFDHHFLDRWRTLLPTAEIETYADCGHYVLEDARDDVIRRIRTFLESNPILQGAAPDEPRQVPSADFANTDLATSGADGTVNTDDQEIPP